MTSSTAPPSSLLSAAGLPEQAVDEWSRALPTETGDYEFGHPALWLVLAPVGAPPSDAAAEAAAKRGRTGGCGRAAVSFARNA